MVRGGDDTRDASEETSREMHGTRPRRRSQGRDDARSARTMSHCRDYFWNDNQLMRWSGIGASGVIGDQRWTSDKWRHDGREYGFVTRDVKARGMQARKRRKGGDDARGI